MARPTTARSAMAHPTMAHPEQRSAPEKEWRGSPPPCLLLSRPPTHDPAPGRVRRGPASIDAAREPADRADAKAPRAGSEEAAA